ncbi:MAG TPA: hypothetical protein VGP78_10080 [Solirubrobacteraceae bacterium]|nr:hypothetical protein [Solirubrobacteraceae bacterium]
MRRAAALWLVLFAAYATALGLPASPGEDLAAPEARNLLVTQSIVRDGDLDLRDDFGARAWSDDYGGDLAPISGPRDGRLVEPQGIGFPLLCAPADALGGRIGVEAFLAALTALAFVLAAALGRRLVPEPWATAAALAVGLSPPVVVAATTIAPEGAGAALLAGAAVLALRIRDEPRPATAFWCATLLAVAPWLAVKLAAPAAVIAVALARWLRRRARGLAGFVALEVVVFAAVLFVSVNNRLYGGLTPYAAVPDPGPTGVQTLGEHLRRWPRLAGLWIDCDVGLVRWAPVLLLSVGALVLLARSRRERLARIVPEQVHVEVVAGFLAVVAAAVVLVAVFLAPTIAGPWPPGHELVPALPMAAALSAWTLRRLPRTGRVLVLLTVVATVWMVAGVRLGDGAGIAPPRGPLPWGGAEQVLPDLR